VDRAASAIRRCCRALGFLLIAAWHECRGDAWRGSAVLLVVVAGREDHRLSGQLLDRQGLVDDLAVVVVASFVPVAVEVGLDGHVNGLR
jgi:hypothetical protein